MTTPVPSSTTVVCRAGDGVIPANWVTEEHLNKTRPRSRAILVQVVRPLHSLQETPTPVPSLTTVMCRVGEADLTANWAMVEQLHNPRQRSRAASVQVAPLHFLSVISMTMVRSIFSKHIPTLTIENPRSLPEITTPAPYSRTVMCRAGDVEATANWVMVQRLTNQHPRSPAALSLIHI